MWYMLHLTFFIEGESEESPAEEMFEGEDFEARYQSYEMKEENGDELYEKVVDKISSIITIWYISGSQDKDNLDSYLEAMKEDQEALSEEEDEEEVEPANA